MAICSFCAKDIDQHLELIFIKAPSRDAYVCEECVDVCVRVVAQRKKDDAKAHDTQFGRKVLGQQVVNLVFRCT